MMLMQKLLTVKKMLVNEQQSIELQNAITLVVVKCTINPKPLLMGRG
jgi:hypothetical protein